MCSHMHTYNFAQLTIFSKITDSTALTEKNPATTIMKTDTAMLVLSTEMAVIQPLQNNHYITLLLSAGTFKQSYKHNKT